jgi:ubiquinone biosynthesis protein
VTKGQSVFRKKGGINYRHIGRYGEIASILVKYGFGDLLSRINLERYINFGKRILKVKPRERVEEISRYDRVRMVLEELGPTFIKLGQFASNRPDILPHELIISLERLQDAVPVFPEKDALNIIEAELGRPVLSLFETFSEKPFASASMAQVHKAKLKGGIEVAVKVQRPRITDVVNTDLEIMYHLATLIEKHFQNLEAFNPLQLVNEFSNAIVKELDFNAEANHIEQFEHNFRGDPTMYVPKVYREFTTRKVITTEFIHGIKISNIRLLKEADLDPREIARRGADIVLKQIFMHGFFHADPHPGNILVKKDNVICFLDMGMTGIITPSSREHLSRIIIGIAERNPQKIVKTLLHMADHQIDGREELEFEIAELIQEYASRSLVMINIGDILNRLSKLLVTHKLRLIPGFYLLVKAVVTMEGLGLRLNPEFNMMFHLEPFAKKMVQDQFGPIHLAKEGVDTLSDIFFLLRDIPSEAREIIQLFKGGKIKFGFEHRGLDPMLRKFDQIVNRLVFGLVLASLVIGSSIVVLSKIPPLYHDLPVIGIIGYIAAFLMGFWLLISILRHEKM